MKNNETPACESEIQTEQSKEEAVPFFAHLLNTQVKQGCDSTRKYPSDSDE